jgi:hypothetical protein
MRATYLPLVLASIISLALGMFIGDKVGLGTVSLRLVGVAFCPYDHADASCTLQLAPRVERHWVYRPSLDTCLEMADEIISRDEGVRAGKDFARIYCPRTESWGQAHSELRAFDSDARPKHPRF